MFGDDIGSQTFVAPATDAFTKLGGTIAINQPITLGASSYRTEVAKPCWPRTPTSSSPRPSARPART